MTPEQRLVRLSVRTVLTVIFLIVATWAVLEPGAEAEGEAEED